MEEAPSESLNRTRTEKRCRELASRVAYLIRREPDLSDTLDFAIGAIYALLKAIEFGYVDRTKALSPNYWTSLATRAENMGRGTLPGRDHWVAGFYFNSALMRISAVYERTAKKLSGRQRGDVPHLLRLIDPPFVNNPQLEKVRIEVNNLKHEECGLSEGRKVKLEEAIGALIELVDEIQKRCLPRDCDYGDYDSRQGPRR
jgi:hypothetical protein